MLQFLNIFDRQVSDKAAEQNQYVAELKEELRPYVEAARAKLPGLKKAWKERDELFNEINSHRYIDGLPRSCEFYLQGLRGTDPALALKSAIEQYENISYSDINDGCGLDRWPVDYNRRAAVFSSIVTLLKAADQETSIRRNVAAVREKLEEHAAAILRDGPEPAPLKLPAMAEPERRVEVRTDYRPLKP